MNFLITTEHYYPKRNGVQNKTQELAEFLAKKNNVVYVITSSVNGSSNYEKLNNVNIYRVDLRTNKSIYFGDKKEYLKIFFSKINDVDVLINVATQNAFTDIILPHLSKFKVVKILYFHGMSHFSFPNVPVVNFRDILSWILNITRWKLYYYMNKNNFNKYSYTIHLHRQDPTYKLIKNSKSKIIIENVIKPVRNNKIISKDNYYLCVSNYMADKNQEFVLEAFYLSDTKRKLIFVGSYESNYLLKLKILKRKFDKKYSRKDVIFIVNEPREITLNRFKEAFIFLFGSKSEKYPIVISESMANSLPFISTFNGITQHLKGGVLVKNVKEMSRYINDLEKNQSLYKTLSNDGYNYSRKTKKLKEQIMDLLKII